MTYHDLTKENKKLYGLLESNTRQLDMTDENYYESEYNSLMERRMALKQQIEVNLTLLDDFLFGKRTLRRVHSRANPGQTKKIIEAYKKNPSASIKTLAEGLGVGYDTFSRTITAHLAWKYG